MSRKKNIYLALEKVHNSLLKPLWFILFILTYLMSSYFLISVEWIYPIEKIGYALLILGYIFFIIKRSKWLNRLYSVLITAFLIIQLIPWSFFLVCSIDFFGGSRTVYREWVDFKFYYIIKYQGYNESSYTLKQLMLTRAKTIQDLGEDVNENELDIVVSKYGTVRVTK